MEKTFSDLINDYIVAGAENNQLRRMKKQDSIKKQWIKKRAKASNPPEPLYVTRGTFRKRKIVNNEKNRILIFYWSPSQGPIVKGLGKGILKGLKSEKI